MKKMMMGYMKKKIDKRKKIKQLTMAKFTIPTLKIFKDKIRKKRSQQKIEFKKLTEEL